MRMFFVLRYVAFLSCISAMVCKTSAPLEVTVQPESIEKLVTSLRDPFSEIQVEQKQVWNALAAYYRVKKS